MSTPINKSVLDANIERVKRDYAESPAMRDAILARFAADFTAVDDSVASTASRSTSRDGADAPAQGSDTREARLASGRATDDDLAHPDTRSSDVTRYVERFGQSIADGRGAEWRTDNSGEDDPDLRTAPELAASLQAEDARRNAEPNSMEGMADRVSGRIQAALDAYKAANDDLLAKLRQIGVEGPEAEAAAKVAGERARTAFLSTGTSGAE